MSGSNTPEPETTIALIFGASRWPDCPKFQDAPSLERSADAFIHFLRSEQGLGIPFRNIKSLFNSYDDPAEQLDQARIFVNRRRQDGDEKNKAVRDLIIYYAGHGDFEGEARDFYLTIRRAHKDHPLLTNITASSFGNWLRQTARDLRAYLIVDCCFAAALQHGFLSSPLGLAELRLNEALPHPAVFDTDEDVPTAGVALLAAAGLNDPASAPPNELYTRFTATLLEVLHDGNERLPPALSLSDLHQLIDRRIHQKFPEEARPELRSLQQTRGRVELVRLFRNPAAERIEEQRRANEAARLTEEKRKADEVIRLAEEKVSRLAEETRIAEAAQLAGEKRRADEIARQNAAQRKADAVTRQADELRKAAEAVRRTEEQRQPDHIARQAKNELFRVHVCSHNADHDLRQAASGAKVCPVCGGNIIEIPPPSPPREHDQAVIEEAGADAGEDEKVGKADEAARLAVEQRNAEEASQAGERRKAQDAARAVKAEEAVRAEEGRRETEEAARLAAENEAGAQQKTARHFPTSKRQTVVRLIYLITVITLIPIAVAMLYQFRGPDGAAQRQVEQRAADKAAQLQAQQREADKAAQRQAQQKAADEAAQRQAQQKAADEAAQVQAWQKAADEAAQQQAQQNGRAWLGVRIQQITPDIAESLGLQDTSGAIVAGINDGGPADKAKIHVGDVILKFNNQDLKEMRSLPPIVMNSEVGKSVPVLLWRDGKEKTLQATLSEKPDDTQFTAPAPNAAPATYKGQPQKPTEISGLDMKLAPITRETRDKFSLNPNQGGVVITDVDPNGSAAEKGLKSGDVIIALQHGAVASPADVQRKVDSVRKENGKFMMMLIQRQDGVQWVPLPLKAKQPG